MALDWQAEQTFADPVASALGGARGFAPAVDLLSASYILTSALEMTSRYAHIVGHGAILEPHASFSGTAGLLADGTGWRITIDGLQFQDFATAIYLDSSNVNSGVVNIRNCGFFNSSSRAVFLECQSSITTIADCLFRDNKRELYIEKGDRVVMQRGWISRGVLDEDYDGGIVVADSNAILTMLDVCGVPRAQTVTDPCWVKNYGSLIARRVRFGGETGSHAVCNNFAAADLTFPINPRRVDIAESDVYCANGDRTAVRLFDLPNVVRVRDNYGFPDQSYVAWGSTVNGDAIISAALTAQPNAAAYGYVRVDTAGNSITRALNGGALVPTNLADFAV